MWWAGESQLLLGGPGPLRFGEWESVLREQSALTPRPDLSSRASISVLLRASCGPRTTRRPTGSRCTASGDTFRSTAEPERAEAGRPGAAAGTSPRCGPGRLGGGRVGGQADGLAREGSNPRPSAAPELMVSAPSGEMRGPSSPDPQLPPNSCWEPRALRGQSWMECAGLVRVPSCSLSAWIPSGRPAVEAGAVPGGPELGKSQPRSPPAPPGSSSLQPSISALGSPSNAPPTLVLISHSPRATRPWWPTHDPPPPTFLLHPIFHPLHPSPPGPVQASVD